MWDQLFVIIQRILAGIFVGGLGTAAIIFVVSGIEKRREKKQLKKQIKEQKTAANKEQTNQNENQTEVTQEQTQIPVAVQQMEKDALDAGLICYEMGNLLAACKETKWMVFMRKVVNSGMLEQSIKEKHLDNAMVYTADGGAVFRLQGKLDEITTAFADAPFVGKEVVVLYDCEKDEKLSYEVEITTEKEAQEVQAINDSEAESEITNQNTDENSDESEKE